MLRTRKGVPTASSGGVSNVEPRTIIPHVLNLNSIMRRALNEGISRIFELVGRSGQGKFSQVHVHVYECVGACMVRCVCTLL